MKVLVLGATGRVGAAVVEQAAAAGHDVTAFVRDPKRLQVRAASMRIAKGDVYDASSLSSAIAGQDAVVVAVGADPLKPSTLVGDTAAAVVGAMQSIGVRRYLGVSGTAEMPQSFLGNLTVSIMRRTPVGHAIRDHDVAFAKVSESSLNWTLAGCPYIKDGPKRGNYQQRLVFPGGFKVIHPGDVADFFCRELGSTEHERKTVGIWY